MIKNWPQIYVDEKIWKNGQHQCEVLETRFLSISLFPKMDNVAKSYEFFKKVEFSLQETGFLAKKVYF